MENKCNKTPNGTTTNNNNNSSNNNNKYLDHVYCHTSESKNYIRANNNNNNNNASNSGGSDIMALLKENKQLKAMLILHLDLIQEQSDQLITKDKLIVSQRHEIETLHTRNAQLEAQVQELQTQLQLQIKRVAAATGELSSIPPPPLAKITNKSEPTVSVAQTTVKRNIIGECNGKLISKIILQRVNLHSPNSNSSASDVTSEADDNPRKLGTIVAAMVGGSAAAVGGNEIEEDEEEDDDEDDVDSEETGNSTEDSNDVPLEQTKRMRRPIPPQQLSLNIACDAMPRRPLVATLPAGNASDAAAMGAGVTVANVQLCVTPPTPSRGKQMPLMLWHAPEMHSDESASCDSIADAEQCSTSAASPASTKISMDGRPGKHKHSNLAPPQRAKARRCAYISTPQMYSTREWEDEEFNCDYEFIKEEAEALHADAPMLEIPKWTEHELSVSYSIEGTEDLSDEVFLKRHAKLEVDEKRRKKWDVQQIREQKRIEKLKRRHCKDEILTPPEQQTVLSFYPQPDAIQTICYINDLPVQAFGELIPKLNTNAEFGLPWLEATATAAPTTATTFKTVATLHGGGNFNSSSTSAQAQQQMLNSSFVFLKKRKRQQSASISASNQARQRGSGVGAAKMGAQISAAAATVIPTTSTTTTTTTSSSSTTDATK